MAIKSSQGFSITSQDSIDSRLVMTKAEMAAAKIATLPTNYIAICKDDGKLYVYNSENEKLQDVGRFRLIDELITFASPSAKEQFDQTLSESTEFSTLEDKVDGLDERLDNTVLDDISGTVDGGEIE